MLVDSSNSAAGSAVAGAIQQVGVSVYILAITNITDAEKYNNESMPAIKKAHKAQNVKVVAMSNAPHQRLMGEFRGNHVVILQVQYEAHARAFWSSPEAKVATAIASLCMSEGRIGIIPGATELVAA